MVGGTGVQGRGVVTEMLKCGWNVRVLTRQPESERAKELASQSVEVVKGDIENRVDVENLFAGVDAVFANFPENFAAEEQVGKLLVDVAKEKNVGFYVYSSLANVEKITNGTHNVPPFSAKGKVEEYMFKSGIPCAAVQVCSYYENWLTYMRVELNKEGVYEFSYPVPGDCKHPLGFGAETGLLVAKMVVNKDDFIGRKVPFAAEYITPKEVAAILTKVWGKPVQFTYIPREVYAAFPFPTAPLVADFYDYVSKYGYYGEKVAALAGFDVLEAKKVIPALTSFEDWARKYMPQPITHK